MHTYLVCEKSYHLSSQTFGIGHYLFSFGKLAPDLLFKS